MQEQMRCVSTIEELDVYSEIVLTGGEPMEHPDYVALMLGALRMRVPERPIYLYISKYHHMLIEILPLVDGVTWTVHGQPLWDDTLDFNSFQRIIETLQVKNSRLLIMARANARITIKPQLWSRIEYKLPYTEAELVLPKGEELLIWTGRL